MVIGVAAYLYVQQSVADCGSFVGQLGRLFSSQMQSQCQMLNLIQLGGGALFVIGIGLTIGGAAAKGR